MGNRTRDIPEEAEWTDDNAPEGDEGMCEGGACTFKRGVGDAYPDPRPMTPNT